MKRDVEGLIKAGDIGELRLLQQQWPALARMADRQGLKPLHLAARYGRAEMIAFLLELDDEPRAGDKQGRTALHYAAAGGHLEAVSLLLSAGLHIDGRDAAGATPLMAAVQGRHHEVLKVLLEHHAFPDACLRDKRRPLHIAAGNGDLESMNLLLATGINVNGYDHNKPLSPLHSAAAAGKTAAARLLLERQAVVDLTTDEGVTALHMAARKGRTGLVRLLLDFGANPNAATQEKETACDLAAREGHQKTADLLRPRMGDGRIIRTVECKDMEKLEILLKAGADPDERDGRSRTALHLAVAFKDMRLAEMLLEAGASPDIRDSEGCTALKTALKSKDVEMVRFLLRRGADPFVPNIYMNWQFTFWEKDMPSLMCTRLRLRRLSKACQAAKRGRLKVLQKMKAEGVDFSAQDANETSKMLIFAAGWGHPEVVRFLLDEGACVHGVKGFDPPVFNAAYIKDTQTMRQLLSRGAFVDHRNRDGETPLMYALAYGSIDTVRLLLEHGADIHAEDNEFKGLFHYAVRSGDAEKVRLLADLGLSVNNVEDGQESLLVTAAENGHSEVVIGLLAAGADVRRAGREGQRDTILHIAAKECSLEAVQALIEAGADPEAQNKEECTPLYSAAQGGNRDVFMFLLGNYCSSVQQGTAATLQMLMYLLDKKEKEKAARDDTTL